jgi:hypothetical protein
MKETRQEAITGTRARNMAARKMEMDLIVIIDLGLMEVGKQMILMASRYLLRGRVVAKVKA